MKGMGFGYISAILGLVLISGSRLYAASTSTVASTAPVMAAASRRSEPQMEKKVISLALWFAEGKSDLKRGPHNEPVLRRLSRELKKYPLIHVEIEGNPDLNGTPESNQALSRRRAEALSDAMVDAYGIPSGRIQIFAAGESGATPNLGPALASAQSSEMTGTNKPLYVILFYQSAEKSK